jgi:hypothetical protein
MCGEEVEAGSEVAWAPVTRQEHADEIFDGEPLHWETQGGRPVVSVWIVVVYVAQNSATRVEDLTNWR